MARTTITEATGYKQLKDLKHTESKVVDKFIIHYGDLFVLFTDKTFVHLDVEDTSIALNYYSDSSYYELFREDYINKKIVLSALGRAMGADIDELTKMYNEERTARGKEQRDAEYELYLTLKEKFENS